MRFRPLLVYAAIPVYGCLAVAPDLSPSVVITTATLVALVLMGATILPT
jgi:hypothetical protein